MATTTSYSQFAALMTDTLAGAGEMEEHHIDTIQTIFHRIPDNGKLLMFVNKYYENVDVADLRVDELQYVSDLLRRPYKTSVQFL